MQHTDAIDQIKALRCEFHQIRLYDLGEGEVGDVAARGLYRCTKVHTDDASGLPVTGVHQQTAVAAAKFEHLLALEVGFLQRLHPVDELGWRIDRARRQVVPRVGESLSGGGIGCSHSLVTH